MKEHEKTTLHLKKDSADGGQSFCILSPLSCFCTFSRPFLTEMKFTETFLQFLFFWRGFFSQLPNRTQLCWRRTLLVLGRTCFALEMSSLVLETNALKTCVQTSATHSATAVATSHFQTELKTTVVSKLSCSPPSTLHPQVTLYKCTIVLSAGLNGLQVG